MSQEHPFDRAVLTPDEAVAFVQNILESSTEYAIVANDLDGRIVLWNEGARRIYGYAPQEVIGKPIFWQVPNDARSMIESRNAGVPLLQYAPRSKIQQSIAGLAQAVADCEQRGLGPVLQTEFAQNVADVALHGAFADDQ